jgi:hypothetical protein
MNEANKSAKQLQLFYCCFTILGGEVENIEKCVCRSMPWAENMSITELNVDCVRI